MPSRPPKKKQKKRTRDTHGAVSNVKVKWIKIVNTHSSSTQRSAYFETDHASDKYGWFPLSDATRFGWALAIVSALYNANGTTTGTISYTYDDSTTHIIKHTRDDHFIKGFLDDPQFSPFGTVPPHHEVTNMS